MLITKVGLVEKAALDEEFFKQVYPGNENIKTEADLRNEIKAEIEKYYAQSARNQVQDQIYHYLVDHVNMELPENFLKRWLQNGGEKPKTAEEAEAEYAKSENGLRYQLIEGKIITENGLQITFDDLKAYTTELIKKQMAQFGQMNPTDEDVQGIVARVMSNQDEVRRLSEQVMNEKMLNLFKDKVKAKTKEVNYDEFIKAMYGELKH